MQTFLFRLVLLASLFAVSPATAQDPQTQPAAKPEISTDIDPGSDQQIDRRLEGIFAEIEGLAGIRVISRNGVVTLRGDVASSDLAERARAIVAQTEDVVDVTDEIAVSRDVGDRVEPALSKLQGLAGELLPMLPLLIIAAVIVSIAIVAYRAVGHLERPFARLAPNAFIAGLIRQFVQLGLLAGGVILALEVLDATGAVRTVLGAAGILGLALGFAMRDLVENYISSIMLSLRQPFAPHDHVLIDGHEGLVIKLTSRATILMTFDGNHVRIPNAQVFKGIVVNYTRKPERRFDFLVGVDPQADLASALAMIESTLTEMPGVLDDPAPGAWIEQLGASTVDILVTGWIDQRRHDFARVRSEAIRLVKERLEGHSIGLPEPAMRVRLVRSPSQERPVPVSRDDHAALRDTRADAGLERQVAQERTAAGNNDLLQHDRREL